MVAKLRLDIDLAFSLTEPGRDGRQDEAISGTVTAAGTSVQVFCDNPGAFRGDIPSVSGVRAFAKVLAAAGLDVTVSGPQGPLISLGAVESSMAQRLLTRSPHLRLGSPSVLAPLLHLGRRSLERSGQGSLLPPPTPLPLVPTVNRRISRRITTTHYAPGGGRPRLIFVQDSARWNGQVPREFALGQERTTIGSSPGSDLVLAGLDDLHAEILHDANDEYVLVPHGAVSGSAGGAGPSVLRTGARVQLGSWCFAFFREEYADHGRPFGGRNGGEFAVQRPQRNPRTGATEQDGSVGIGDPRRPPR
ncbi:FHA domain-containing protein [Arthrobacter sp. TMN-37]